MKFDLEWLQLHLNDSPGAATLAHQLTDVGFAVELREEVDGGEVWDVEVTTNRPDAMNHRGLAREAAVASGTTVKPLVVELAESDETAASLAEVRIEDAELCPRFAARVVRGVSIGSSPEWIRTRLERCGIRPINAVVDVTNYVLLALGQPMHAYDLDLVRGRTLVARRAEAGERLTTLDGVERELDEEMLVIADAERAVGIAGVMGGADTEISSETTDVLLEAANFEPVSVRRTARRLGLATEASHRFERGADPAAVDEAIEIAAAMIAELTGGTVARGRIDHWPGRREATRLSLSPARLRRFGGLPIDEDLILRILGGLDFRPRAEGDEIVCTVPSFRVDVERREDLYEEVLRHVGYDRIPSKLPVLSTTPGRRLGHWPLVDRAREAALAEGLAEVMTYAFVADDEDRVAEGTPLCADGRLELANPLSLTQAVMRRSLLPGLLVAAREDMNQGEEDLASFEVGRAFSTDAGEVREHQRLGLVLAGDIGGWDGQRELDFLDLKGVVEGIADAVGLTGLAWHRGGGGPFDEAQSAVLRLDDRTVGVAGLVSSSAADSLGLKRSPYLAELALDAAVAAPRRRYRDLSRFPAVSVDMTVEHDEETGYGPVAAAVSDLCSELVDEVELVARYRGEGVPEGKVRSTLRLTYRHEERSLTQDEVNAEQQALRDALARRLDLRFV